MKSRKWYRYIRRESSGSKERCRHTTRAQNLADLQDRRWLEPSIRPVKDMMRTLLIGIIAIHQGGIIVANVVRALHDIN
jgi:hypothetical protein